MVSSSYTTRLLSRLSRPGRPSLLSRLGLLRHLRAGFIFGLLLAGNSLAGCGSSTSQAVSQPGITHPGITAPTSGAVGGSLAKAQASALAHAINLTSADLPGYSASPQKENNSKAGSVEQARCMGAPNPHLALAEVNSENFARTGPEVNEGWSSTVTVMPSAASAAKYGTALHSARGEMCIEKSYNKVLAEGSNEKAAYGPISIAEIPAEVLGVSGGFGFHIATDVTGTARAFYVLYIDVLRFVDGPIEVSLEATSHSHPIAPATEHHLLSLLAARARAHHP
jgi:hypothetical protein